MTTGKKKVRPSPKPMDIRLAALVRDEYAAWRVHPEMMSFAHFVPSKNNEITNVALCGLRVADSEVWKAPKGGETTCSTCVARLELQQNRTPAAQEHVVNFVQTIGEVIPLCWIPVADVQMIVKLLHQHMPEPTLRASRAQFQGVIDALNTYVGEALERNAKANAVGTWTAPDQEKKGKK